MRYEKHGLCGKCGVYAITNKANGKKYVGASVDVGSRINQHFTTVARKYYGINEFYTDIIDYGRDNFAYELLEECERSRKYERERYWFDFLKPAYNLVTPSEITPLIDPRVMQKSRSACQTEVGRNNILTAHRSQHCRDACRKAQERRMVAVEMLNDNGIVDTFVCMHDAAKYIKPNHPMTALNHIRACIKGERKRAYGYKWKEVVCV